MTGPAQRHRLPPAVDPISTLRPGVPRDAPVVSRLQSYLRESDPDLLEYAIETRSVIVTTAGPPGGLPSDMPVGYLLYVGGDGTRDERRDAHIAELVVAPPYRRDGRGRALVAHLLTTVSGQLSLLVDPENDAALSLYRSMGFTVSGERSAVYEDGPALLLVSHPSSDSESSPGCGAAGSTRKR